MPNDPRLRYTLDASLISFGIVEAQHDDWVQLGSSKEYHAVEVGSTTCVTAEANVIVAILGIQICASFPKPPHPTQHLRQFKLYTYLH